jgi:glycosyltransferase involved in cell wall biosynthesis
MDELKNQLNNMTKTVLYISYDGMTDPLGQSQVLPYLKGLTGEGFKFHIISFEKEERFETHRAHIQAICDESGIVWHPLKYTKKPPLLSTIYDVVRMHRLAYELHKSNRFSIAHCRSYLSAMVGMAMKRKFGVKFIFDMRGFWADERIEGGIWSLKNPVLKVVYNYFKRKEIQYFQQADHIVSLTYNGKQEIESWDSLKSSDLKIEVIPCCVDLDLFDPKSIDFELVKSLRGILGYSDEDFVLGYVGSIGTWYMLSEMLDYFLVLSKNNSAAKMLFVSGENPKTITELAERKKIDTSKIKVVSCLHKEVPLYVSLFSQSIFFIRPTFSKKASSPTKQGEIMAMGIPLVCNAGVGDTDFIVKKYKSGSVIEMLDFESYKKNILTVEVFETADIQFGADDFFSLKQGVSRYLKVYQTVLQKQD